jgi:adenylosuccinate synthase
MFGEEAEKLREAGAEYGAKTGRPRRVGPMDLVATRYGVEVQGATELALTKLDVLSDMETIPVCVRYQTAQGETDDFLFPTLLASAKPVIEYVPGWKSDISGARRWDDLPKAAQDYVNLIQNAVGAPITYISVGPERDSYIHREG